MGTFDGAGCVADETLISALLAAYCCSNSSVVLDLKSPVKCKGSPKHDQAMSEECTQTLRIIISKTIFVKSSRSVQRQISNRHVLEMASNSPICALRRCGKRFKQLTPVTSEMNYCSFEKRDWSLLLSLFWPHCFWKSALSRFPQLYLPRHRTRALCHWNRYLRSVTNNIFLTRQIT